MNVIGAPAQSRKLGLGIAEVRKDAVAQIFGNKAAEAVHSFRDAWVLNGAIS
jgi:hypothetical protein